MTSFQEKRSAIRFVNPAAAANHYRWHRAFYMDGARRSVTESGRKREVACARLMNVSLVSALRQARIDGAAILNCGGVGRKLEPPAQEGQR